MPPTPVIPTSRVHLPYTVNGEDHNLHLYCETVGTTAPWSLAAWAIVGNPTFQDAAEALCAALQDSFDQTLTTFGEVLLEAEAGGSWVPIEAHTPTVVPDSARAFFPASQVTNVLRDDQFRQVRVVVMESTYGNPLRARNPAALPDPLKNFALWLQSVSNDTDGGNWIHSRGGGKIIGFISTTATDNKRIRRNRGLI